MPAPTLRPGDVVIADTLQSHKRRAVREVLRRVGAKLLFLPKHSPDLNPIEQVFAKLKHLPRKAAPSAALPPASAGGTFGSSARTQEAVCEAIGALLDRFTAEERANYFRNSGYGST